MNKTDLRNIFKIDQPIIMAPMFLVSDFNMIKAAMKNGIIGTFPSLNYRNENELEGVLKEINSEKDKPENTGIYGINLIVQRSNPFYKKHLELCVKYKVPFYITSLGNPKEVIKKAHEYGGKVFCDVTNLQHAQKVVEQGADGLIAVGQGAGGHAGPNPLQLLIPALRKEFDNMPVIAAGGVSDGHALLSVMNLGADGASVGTRFIASDEAPVSDEYKNAVVNSKMDDIVMTERISGTPSTVINNDYAKKIGYRQNAFEKMMNKNKTIRKYFKMLVQVRGMKKLEKSVKPGNYKNLWIAGKSVELINEILPIKEIVNRYKQEYELAEKELKSRIC